MDTTRPHVLFVCTGNAGRSQMAEALFKRLAGGNAAVSSAGVEPWDHLHPVAVRLMQERGIDLVKDGQRPKNVRSLAETAFDLVITLGARALEQTPELRGNPRRMHLEIKDPADADSAGADRQEAAFRFALTEIEKRLPEALACALECARAGALHLAAGISTCFSRPDFTHPNAFDPAQHLPLLAKAGFKCIELNLYLGGLDFAWDRPDRLRELAAAASDNGIRIFSVHAVGDWVTQTEPRHRRLMIDLAKASADVAAMLGAHVIPFHAGLPQGLERAAGEAVLQDVLSELEAHVLATPCIFGWENEAMGLTAEEHLGWIRRYRPGAIGFVLDTGHSNRIGNTEDYLAVAGLRLCGLHLNDNRGATDDHILPGLGSSSWGGFTRKLLRTGYIGPLMLEIHDFARQHDLPALLKDAADSLERLRSQISSKEERSANNDA
ncbi:MAG: TIM barrel protein [Lentisphaerae bacterium]|nr:TIM barrel protein [Lentisphaerota bacterium]